MAVGDLRLEVVAEAHVRVGTDVSSEQVQVPPMTSRAPRAGQALLGNAPSGGEEGADAGQPADDE